MERKKNPSAFIRNTYTILQRVDLNHIIAWNEDGNGFIIHDLPKFQSEILPQYFKHQKYTSFVRQLNMYGFHKQRHPLTQNYFQHESFRRGQNLSEIKRKPERKKKNEEQNSGNQAHLDDQHMKQEGQSQNASQNGHILESNPEIEKEKSEKNIVQHNPEEIIKEISTNWSLGSLCEQAILQNQILIKIHPILMSYSLKLKKQRIKQIKEEEDDDENANEIITSLSQIIKSQTMKLSSLLDLSM